LQSHESIATQYQHTRKKGIKHHPDSDCHAYQCMDFTTAIESFVSIAVLRDMPVSANSGPSRSYSNLGFRLQQMRKTCVKSQDEAVVIATTARRSKGLEWDSVHLAETLSTLWMGIWTSTRSVRKSTSTT
jgi:hypothetical protein